MIRKILFLLFISPILLIAQSDNAGTEFWLGFMDNYGPDHLRVYVSASQNSKVFIKVPLQNIKDSFVVLKDSVYVYEFAKTNVYIGTYDKIEPRGIQITSDFPVSVSAMNLTYATTDASIVFPLANIPTDPEYITSHPNTGSKNIALLVANSDSTKIEITPAVNTVSGKAAKNKFKLTLNIGQVYQLASTPDLTGTHIKVTSGHKLMVFSGDYCSNFPAGACDHQFEQVIPNIVVDTAYLSPPQLGFTGGYVLKMVPLDTVNTTIKVNNRVYNNVTCYNPLKIDVSADSGFYISSNRKFHCIQFLKGPPNNKYITSNFGDPSMLELVSSSFMGQKSLFSTVNSSNLKDHFVSIVINTKSKNNVYLDNIKVDSSEFKIFPFNNAYAYTGIKLSLGAHTIQCSQGHLAYSYGIGFYESYLYLAGFSLPNFDLTVKDSIVKYDCKNKTIKKQFKELNGKYTSYKWTFSDGTSYTGNPISKAFTALGDYSFKLVATAPRGKKDSITKNFKIAWPEFNPVVNRVICGADTVKFEELNPFFSYFKWQDSTTNNFIRITNTQKVWVRAKDTSGYCVFYDSGKVQKATTFTKLFVDTINSCFKNNLFLFRDSSTILADQIAHKTWVFPWQSVWDTNRVAAKFPMPGKYKVYFDVYTKVSNCKARYPIDILVRPQPMVFPKVRDFEVCGNEKTLFYDSSKMFGGKIKSIQINFDDGTFYLSDSLKVIASLKYDKINNNILRYYKHITTTDMGCKDTAINALTVWPSPEVKFDITSPDTIKCLPAARWSYSSNTTVYNDTFALYWNSGNGKTGTASALKNIRYFNQGIYKVKLTAVSTIGCIDSAVKYVEVIDIPKASFTINDSSQCLRNNLFVFKSNSIGKYLKFNWYGNDSLISHKANIDTFYAANSGVKLIKLSVNTPYAGCLDSTEKQIAIFKNPKGDFKFNKDTQCLVGNSFNFINKGSFSQVYKSSEWTWANKRDTNRNVSNVNVNAVGSFNVKLKITDIENCWDTMSKNIQIITLPKFDFNINDSVQCLYPNEFIIKTSLLQHETTNWFVQNKLIHNNIDSFGYVANNIGKYKITLEKKNSECKDSIIKYFTVVDNPKANFIINKDTQCFVGQNFDFINASSTNAQNNFISWRYHTLTNDYLTQDAKNIQFASIGKHKVKLIVNTIQNCIDSIEKEITITENPNAVIFADTVCANNLTHFKAVQQTGETITFWNWQFGDGNTSNINKPTYLYAADGKYIISLEITDKYGCKNVNTISTTAVVNPLPNSDFTYLNSAFDLLTNKLLFTPKVLSNTKYVWRMADGKLVNSDTTSIVINQIYKGDVTLTVTNKFGCIDSTSHYINEAANNFVFYIPNSFTPNGDNLNQEFNPIGLEYAQNYNFSIYNRWGEQVFISNSKDKGWDGSFMNEIVEEGVYTYLLKFTYINGKQYQFRGTFTLLR